MPFIIERTDAPSKMYAAEDADRDIFWTANRDKAARYTETEADIFVHEFGKFSDIELDIIGVKAAPAETTAEAA